MHNAPEYYFSQYTPQHPLNYPLPPLYPSNVNYNTTYSVPGMLPCYVTPPPLHIPYNTPPPSSVTNLPALSQILDPSPPGSDDKVDDTARLQEEFIRKCKNTNRTNTPPPRRKRSRSRSLSRETSRIRCTDSKPISPSYRSRSRSYRRSRSKESRRRFKERSVSSSASDEYSQSQKTKRQELLDRWRLNNCNSRVEMSDQLEEICKMKPEDIIEKEKHFWTRTAPADLYYVRCDDNPRVSKGTEKLMNLCERFEYELIKKAARANAGKPAYAVPSRRHKLHHHKCCSTNSDSESDTEAGELSGGEEEEGLMEELERKKAHPDRLHPELWYNDPGEMNDGPLCRCSAKAKRSGIRHNIYAGELNLEKCDVLTNNADRLYHYRITVSPPTNFLIKTPTIIEHDNHEYIFEGFSMLSHKPLENLPVCKVIRFNIEYTILYIEEKLPEHFIIKELNLFYDYLFKEILELVDLDFKAAGDSNGCSQFHFMPRFVRELPENGKELLSMNEVLHHLLASSKPLICTDNLKDIICLSNYKWQNYVDEVKGMVVTFPGKKPCSLRVDQLDRDQSEVKTGQVKVPEVVHFGIRPPQLSYAGNPEYQKAWREYVKFRHLLANMPKASFEDKRKLESKENKLQEMRTQSKMKRDVTIAISAEGFYRTGIMCDIVQHAMLIPVLVSHLRFHRSLDVLEVDIGYIFKNRNLLQLALTHPSYRENFGTNPDHARNSLTNCSIRQPEYGDRRIHYLNTRKRGINTLINIMSRFGKQYETESNITHNERLEFLGDAVVEFVTSIHLFHLFPRLEEGGLATYRAAIVQNQHLAVLAKKLGLDGYMLYAHGSDLCHDLELRHAMANCFEALMGALFLDGGIEAADKVFGESLFKESKVHLNVWVEYPLHPLQEQEPNGDRQWITSFKILQDLTNFERSIGVEFTHIRLLARAFTDRSIGYTNLTLGSNQRLEFLGDTVLQLIASDYLYKYFPEHHEGHLSLLRSSLVNNRTQAVVCDDLGISTYAIYANPKAELKTKDRADLLEAFLGALYVDKGLHFCETFCNVCFFPRLHDFIMHQDWNDPKSKLQQCCLTLRTMEGGEPEIPIYKVIECMGPTNTRLYTVAVYFKGKRLAQATGHSIQQAEMNAAKEALDNSQKLFPQLDHQKRVIAKSIKQDPPFEQDKKSKKDGERKSPQNDDRRSVNSSSGSATFKDELENRIAQKRARSSSSSSLCVSQEKKKRDHDYKTTHRDRNGKWRNYSKASRSPTRQREDSSSPCNHRSARDRNDHTGEGSGSDSDIRPSSRHDRKLSEVSHRHNKDSTKRNTSSGAGKPRDDRRRSPRPRRRRESPSHQINTTFDTKRQSCNDRKHNTDESNRRVEVNGQTSRSANQSETKYAHNKDISGSQIYRGTSQSLPISETTNTTRAKLNGSQTGTVFKPKEIKPTSEILKNNVERTSDSSLEYSEPRKKSHPKEETRYCERNVMNSNATGIKGFVEDNLVKRKCNTSTNSCTTEHEISDKTRNTCQKRDRRDYRQQESKMNSPLSNVELTWTHNGPNLKYTRQVGSTEGVRQINEQVSYNITTKDQLKTHHRRGSPSDEGEIISSSSSSSPKRYDDFLPHQPAHTSKNASKMFEAREKS